MITGFVTGRREAIIRLKVRGPTGQDKGIQFMLDMLAPQMAQAKTAKPEQFFDAGVMNELEKEGFFIDLAKRYPAK